ncbi:MAG: hypothetical protein CFH18_00844 [Alphaproteobacteria bacterium MarineAlpha5_Bin8]|nr:MAG: hypothetical protein CFH18_00844 [Alphaproteobacteria bacterium MarineAlpha5_Bin8]PPR46216.1 MAG: hypothetical protein CFH17_00092 [Alphaproteobacteria bacterium MarineAlpha5_Bin7]PPR55020.1 MAG: hypothetical protein CFH16_00054 [Alphaproteobacteria bacterium MarineAlpha5_Bin6]|tara:strand:+ start:3892 stop:4341 length:450 start_codon:yes stop_codon:yes gene_type:complete
MKNLSIELNWTLGDGELTYGKYDTEHKIKINDDITLNAGSAVEYGGNAKNLNPEQALAVAMSSCHMMTFLALAAKMKWPVITYKDKVVAYLGKNSKGKMSVNKIELNPKITFATNFSVSNKEMKTMQDRSHRYCFIANSLSEEVEIIIN